MRFKTRILTLVIALLIGAFASLIFISGRLVREDMERIEYDMLRDQLGLVKIMVLHLVRTDESSLDELVSYLQTSSLEIRPGTQGRLFIFNDMGELLCPQVIGGDPSPRQLPPLFKLLSLGAADPSLPLFFSPPPGLGLPLEPAVAWVEKIPDLGWYLVAALPQSELEVPGRRLMKAIGVTAGLIVILGIGFSLLLGRRLLRPIRELEAEAGQLRRTGFSCLAETVAGFSRLRNRYNDELGDLAGVFALVIEALRKHIEKLKKSMGKIKQFESELQVAHDIQMSMIPTPSRMETPVYSISAYLQPARQVGGDFYDFSHLEQNRVCLVVGDVSDKGVPAALFMSRCLALCRLLIRHDPARSPAQVLQILNQEMVRDNELSMFVTAILVMIDLESGELVFSSAGHLPPILLASNSEPEPLSVSPSLPLGIKNGVEYPQWDYKLNPSDQLVLYTDGITEAMSPQAQLFGLERLLESLSGIDPAESLNEIKEAVNSFAADREPADDITILTFRYLARAKELKMKSILKTQGA